PERLLLAGEAGLAGARELGFQEIQLPALAAPLQRRFELELLVEMVLDHALVAPGHENEMLDPGLARLVHHPLDDRPVDHGEHLLGHGLGGRQEARAQAGHGKNGFSDRFHGSCGPGQTSAPLPSSSYIAAPSDTNFGSKGALATL